MFKVHYICTIKANNMTTEQLISTCYDYISNVTIKQGYLMPVKTLYGDGTRFDNNFKVFETVYNNIKSILP